MPGKVALVLSSGGARGLAHIGVIEELVARGYEISSISGSSIGAVVGAFYASGHLNTYRDWAIDLDRLDLFKLIDFTFSVQGFIRGEKVFKELEKIIPDQLIEEMSIPFKAVATNLRQKEELVIANGSMYEAIKASVAIPTVIKPVERGSDHLVDGAVINPIPIDHVERNPGDLLIVSNVNSMIPYHPNQTTYQKARTESVQLKIEQFVSKWTKRLPGTSSSRKKLGFFDLMNASIDLMQDRLTSLLLEKYNPDFTINISRDACNTFEFYRAEELIEIGREATSDALKSKRSKQPIQIRK